MSNMTGGGGSFSSGNTGEEELGASPQMFHAAAAAPKNNSGVSAVHPLPPVKKRRNLPGTPDPSADVIALSPTTLMATNRFVCEICNKGFQRDQNLQLHRRGHNLPWKLRQRTVGAEVQKRVYVCPEATCVHHNPTRALGDLTGIKKHFCRKHGEKKWKCDKCSKKYAVQSDWKAHSKTCGTKEYKCDCGTIFSRRDSFIIHRAFCDALTEENSTNHLINQALMHSTMGAPGGGVPPPFHGLLPYDLLLPINSSNNGSMCGGISLANFNSHVDPKTPLKSLQIGLMPISSKLTSTSPLGTMGSSLFSTNPTTLSSPRLKLSRGSAGFDVEDGKMGWSLVAGSADMSAMALLQKAAEMGATSSGGRGALVSAMAGPDQLSLQGPRVPYTTSMHHHHDVPYHHGVGVDVGSGARFENQQQLFNSSPAGRGGMTDVLAADLFTKNAVRDSGSGGARMTMDFMGVGGVAAARLQEQQWRLIRQPQMGAPANCQQRLQVQGLHLYHH